MSEPQKSQSTRMSDETSKNYLIGTIFMLVAVIMVFGGILLYQSAALFTTQRHTEDRLDKIGDVSDVNKNNVVDLTRIVEERIGK
jgi:hypothetical protein